MTNVINYDDPTTFPSGQWVTWKEIGQAEIATIAGYATQERKKPDGSLVINPVYTLREDDGAEVLMEVGQAALKDLFKKERPQIGDRVRIIFVGEEKISGKPSPMKKFTLEVSRAGAQAPVTTANTAVANLQAGLGAQVIESTPAQGADITSAVAAKLTQAASDQVIPF